MAKDKKDTKAKVKETPKVQETPEVVLDIADKIIVKQN